MSIKAALVDGLDGWLAASLIVTLAPAANTGGTLTLPAPGANLFHYITNILVTRNATAALVGSATLTITTTNLPGTPSFRVGNAMVAGGSQTDINLSFGAPLKSSVANTATTLVLPAPGAAVLWTATVFYYVSP